MEKTKLEQELKELQSGVDCIKAMHRRKAIPADAKSSFTEVYLEIECQLESVKARLAELG